MQLLLSRNMVLIFGTLVAAIFLASAGSSVEARPNYKKEFDGHYEKVKENNKTSCNVCHKGKDKKVRNTYGKAIEKALDAKKVTDSDKIKEAFKKAEKEKSAVDGKTFGDLLKDGKLPNEGEDDE